MEHNKRLLEEIFETLFEYLPKMIKGIEVNIDLFRKQDENEAINLLIQVVEGLQWIVSVVQETKETLQTYGIEIDEERMNETFTDLSNGVKNQDYLLITDLLEYEVLDMLQNLKQGLESNMFN